VFQALLLEQMQGRLPQTAQKLLVLVPLLAGRLL
jgi:hypothetical protein